MHVTDSQFLCCPKSSTINLIYGTIFRKFFTLAIIVFCLFYPNLNDMLIPVLFYMLVLTIMASLTWMTDKSNGFLVLGGAVFVVSDSILGLNRFYLEIAHADTAIMCSYYLAQFCLVTGFLQATSKHKQPQQLSVDCRDKIHAF